MVITKHSIPIAWLIFSAIISTDETYPWGTDRWLMLFQAFHSNMIRLQCLEDTRDQPLIYELMMQSEYDPNDKLNQMSDIIHSCWFMLNELS